MRSNITRDLIARRLASQTWGDVQKQSKLGDGIWLFHTVGHGGYIVDTVRHPELSKYNSIVETRKESGKYRTSEQGFAAFEEDCMYAIVEWTHPHMLYASVKEYRIGDLSVDLWIQQRLLRVEKSLARYNPEFLAEHPVHGPLTKLD